MIWALIFAIIFASSDSPYVIPKLNKYVKQHVTDKSQSKKMLILLKEDKSHRKSLQKVQKSHMKEMNALNYSRNSSKSDFETIYAKILDERKSMQQSDVNLKIKTQEFITKEEWELIKSDAEKALLKSIKEKNKEISKFEKKFKKFEDKISIIVKDEKKSEEVSESLKSFKKVFLGNLKAYENYVSDENSLLYAYNVSDNEIDEIMNMANGWRKEIFDSYVKTHFTVVESTTPEEWKLIVKNLKKLY
jgi:hypothetical protein